MASIEDSAASWSNIWRQTRQRFEAATLAKEQRDYMHRLYQIAGLAGEPDYERRFNNLMGELSSNTANADGKYEARHSKVGSTAAIYYLKSLIRAERYERACDYHATIDPALLSGYNKRDYLYQKIALETYRGRHEEAWKSLEAYYDYQEANGRSLEEVRADNSVLEAELAARTGRSNPDVEDGGAAGSTAQAAEADTLRVEAHPNPFNPTTTFTVQLQQERQVTLKVYNTLGKEVATLHNGRLSAGEHRMRFNATGLASGLYIYRLDIGTRVVTNTITLLK